MTGVTTVDGNGDIVYTPTSAFIGETIITYTASDGLLSDSGIITINVVAGVNEAPVAADDQNRDNRRRHRINS